MKAALVISGHFRCWETCFPNTKKYIIDKYEPDVFIASWDNTGYWVDPQHDPQGKGINSKSPDLVLADVYDAYKPKGFKFQNYENCEETFKKAAEKYLHYCQEIRPINTLSQFYKIHQGISMMAEYACLHDIKYDLVIRMRPDLILPEGLPELKTRYFYTIKKTNHSGLGTGDMFQMGPLDKMVRFGNIVFNYMDLVEKLNRFCPHMFVKEWMNPDELNIPYTIQHTPNGTYQNWEPEIK